eukprot:CAMPEP_0185740192 /NCGR_PEP_ID=MMETSP1171-20130828/37260_1 /TAXON_ID=374046 /ORGANISM="Helicotheca tamensis, Strain CCMP826" /LENGTH=96 /DNA_ID=CAMNT_0028411981 /DNA_START=1 /DNA_END=287 /DNA_ORIENTATION=-
MLSDQQHRSDVEQGYRTTPSAPKRAYSDIEHYGKEEEGMTTTTETARLLSPEKGEEATHASSGSDTDDTLLEEGEEREEEKATIPNEVFNLIKNLV